MSRSIRSPGWWAAADYLPAGQPQPPAPEEEGSLEEGVLGSGPSAPPPPPELSIYRLRWRRMAKASAKIERFADNVRPCHWREFVNSLQMNNFGYFDLCMVTY